MATMIMIELRFFMVYLCLSYSSALCVLLYLSTRIFIGCELPGQDAGV
ncbi:MAG: hypothetical protein NTY50_10260 [Methylobacter sp.]|nr:hypothetical protein [Methylobacter sp.]